MSEEKSAFRLDMETRVLTGKSPSQIYRHALYELWMQKKAANPEMKDEDFQSFYDQILAERIEDALIMAEEEFKARQPQ